MKDSLCYTIFCWLFQILVWLFLVLTIVFFISDVSAKFIVLILFLASYTTYICLEFCSMACKYLYHKTSEGGIYNKVALYYRSYPVFKFYCECYHYETRRKRVTTRRNGRTHTRTVTRRVRVTTHRETYIFPYYSERDVSGLFYLDCDRALISRKYFIELDIYDEINFADAISCYDYEMAKDSFWRRNRFRDTHFNFNESRYIPGLVRNNLVSLTQNEPCCVNCCAFVFYTLIMFGEFYKLYYNSLCIKQIYRIRKLVSTRYDLNQPIYQAFIPQLDLITQQYNFEFADYNYINNDFHLVAPTTQELEKAKIYQSRVPDYKISSGGGKIHAGVVLDDPSYSSYNLNKPPESFTSIAGDVELKKDQVNPNGAPPPGFDQANFKFNVVNKNNNNNDDSDVDDEPGEGYGSKPINIQNNQAPQPVKISTERIVLKENQPNPQEYQQINVQGILPNNEQYPPQNYPGQQYPPQNFNNNINTILNNNNY